MKKNKSILNIPNIFIRYFLLIIVALPNLWIFYLVFTPLTVYPVYFLTKLLFNTALLKNNILLINGKIPIELIKSCIAGAAYYLLFIFNISVPNIKLRKRVKMILSAFASFLVLNIIRIVLLIILFMNGSSFFDIVHKIFWYSLSTLFIIGIWFAQVRIYNIKDIPVYSDIKSLIKKIKK